MSEIKHSLYYNAIVVSLAILLVGGVIYAAWTEPTLSPPDGNVDAPVNVGTSSQYKIGALGVGGVFHGWSDAIFDGRVGIGTTSPDRQLEVSGVGTQAIEVESTNGTAQIFIDAATDSDSKLFFQEAGVTRWSIVNEGDDSDKLKIQLAGSNTKLTIQSNGNVGIGTADPGYKLDVNGEIRADAYWYSSDVILKKEINVLENSLEKVLNLQGVSFRWKNNEELSIGLIAQDVEKIFPRAVSTSQQSGLKSIDYAKLVAPLIEAIKEQQKEIEELRLEIEKLKN